MPGLRSTLKELLSTDDLYEALGTEKDCSQEQLKRAYRKKSLQHHPDRVQGGKKEKEEATKRLIQ